MDCPFLKKPDEHMLDQRNKVANSWICRLEASNTLHDCATMSYGMFIPPFMMHLIQRPMAHHALGKRAPGVVEGIVIMEFNGQVFRREIVVPYKDRCPHCKQRTDMKDRYELAVADAMKAISRDVNKAVKSLLQEWLDAVDKVV
jgi:hypothetical protein